MGALANNWLSPNYSGRAIEGVVVVVVVVVVEVEVAGLLRAEAAAKNLSCTHFSWDTLLSFRLISFEICISSQWIACVCPLFIGKLP